MDLRASKTATRSVRASDGSAVSTGAVRVEPFRELTLPRPRPTSGLFPAVEEAPRPPVGTALRLRRVVALTVVLGTVSLLAYASWQRSVHATQAARAGAWAR